MQTQRIGLVLLPAAALLLWASLTAADLPAVATAACVGVLLAAYGYLCFRLVSADQGVAQLEESARVGEKTSQARRLVIVDPATNLLAQWYFELRVEEEVLRCLRYKEEMTVLILCPRQDEPLSAFATQQAAGLIFKTVRKTDLAGSLEDGFGICLIHCNRAEAEQVINRIRAEFGPGWQVGMASIPTEEESGQQSLLLARARLKALTAFAA